MCSPIWGDQCSVAASDLFGRTSFVGSLARRSGDFLKQALQYKVHVDFNQVRPINRPFRIIPGAYAGQHGQYGKCADPRVPHGEDLSFLPLGQDFAQNILIGAPQSHDALTVFRLKTS